MKTKMNCKHLLILEIFSNFNFLSPSQLSHIIISHFKDIEYPGLRLNYRRDSLYKILHRLEEKNYLARHLKTFKITEDGLNFLKTFEEYYYLDLNGNKYYGFRKNTE